MGARVRIIALATLKVFLNRSPAYADARDPAMAWYRQVKAADWAGPADVKRDIRTASILKDGRAVFNIAGNKYRIVVWINYAIPRGLHKVHRHASAIRRNRRTDHMKAKVDGHKTDQEHARLPPRAQDIEGLMRAKRNTPQGDRLDVLVALVEAWETKHYPLDLPDPIEAIKYHMEQTGLGPRDLIPLIGGRNRVYEVLARKRPLTLKMIRRLHEGLGIPAESLIKGGRRQAA